MDYTRRHFFQSQGGASSSTVRAVADFLHLSRINVESIILLTSSESQGTLNPSQCRSMSSKLHRTLESIEGMLRFLDGDKSFLNAALENFYLVSDRAKELVESCSKKDWCQASVFQIQNEEAFKEILLETCLCYSAIFELVRGKDGGYHEDLRRSSTFEPPSSAEILQDQVALIEKFRAFVDKGAPVDGNQHLAKYLLRRLECFTSQSNAEDFDVSTLSMGPNGQLGRQIEGLLGENVVKARLLDVPCAIKEFDHYEYEEGAEALILKEARLMAPLNHPNIVKFICCGLEDETSRDFIAMELMERGLHSLIGKLRRAKHRKLASSPFPLLSAVDIMLQIAYGVCYLHENGVAHRDIKTNNVVVRQITTSHLQDYLQVKLVDFGLSKSKLRASKSNAISHPKTGTTVYLAPEAFDEGRANWFKADVYSFGVLCSVILSGNEPFPVKEMPRPMLCEAVRSGTRPMIPSESLPELKSLIQDCWNGERKRRPNFRDICTRLATLRYKLLRGGDPHGDSFQPTVHIEELMKKRSDARKANSLYRLLHIPADGEESSVQNQRFDSDTEPPRNDDFSTSAESLMLGTSPTAPRGYVTPYGKSRQSSTPKVSYAPRSITAPRQSKLESAPQTVVELFVPQCCIVQCQVEIKRCLYGLRGTDHVNVDFDYQKVIVLGVASEEKILREIETLRSGARLYDNEHDGRGTPRPIPDHYH